MLGLNNDDKKLVERPEEEPKFSMKNRVDKNIVRFVIIAVAVGLILLGLVLLLYKSLH